MTEVDPPLLVKPTPWYMKILSLLAVQDLPDSVLPELNQIHLAYFAMKVCFSSLKFWIFLEFLTPLLP